MEKAYNILFSKDYIENKKIYNEGTDQLRKNIIKKIEETKLVNDKKKRIIIISIFMAIILILTGWIIFAIMLRLIQNQKSGDVLNHTRFINEQISKLDNINASISLHSNNKGTKIKIKIPKK